MIQPVSRNHILRSLGYEKAVTNEDVMVLPEDIQYKDRDEDKIILIKGLPVFTLTPRLTFARSLRCFDWQDEGFNTHSGCLMIHKSTLRPLHEPILENGMPGGPIYIGWNTVIGAPGFGYVVDEDGTHLHIPHYGRVVIDENVYIHNFVNIDRGVIGDTVIGKGTRIDSHVHVAHNCQIGENNLIVAGSIIGGSVKTGRGCYLGMGCKIKNKVTLGDNATVGAGAVVLENIPDNETWAGVPARKIK